MAVKKTLDEVITLFNKGITTNMIIQKLNI